MNYINIYSFMSWFIDQFIRIITDTWNKLDTIEIAPGITLMAFIITLIIIEIFLGIVLTAPNRMKLKKEKRVKNDKK